ncbi:Ribonuclease P protein component [Frankliniella fusca]|uniref:Ribonuclease P protein component n=1 Tax=Frankliniella fusca TaxID=407009 RepID=A0AAE1L8Z7_9NEOP|nr:Ribonuclease P protein component [Frankliniella fusca]
MRRPEFYLVQCAQNDPTEKCHIARRLKECFTEANYLFLLCVHPVAAEENRVNLKFQAREAEAAAAPWTPLRGGR